jgi:hypothetical protein
MSRLTVFLARAIGLFTVMLVAALLVRGSAVIEESVTDGPVMLVYATISLAMVLGYNVWTGGALPVVVTLVGWLSLAKGALLLFLAPDAGSQMFEQMRYADPLLTINPGGGSTSVHGTNPNSKTGVRRFTKPSSHSSRIFLRSELCEDRHAEQAQDY